MNPLVLATSEAYDHLSSHLVSAGSSFAGLVLVFLGITISSFDAYDATDQGSVRKKFKLRARIALAGFVFALISVACAVVSEWAWRVQLVNLGTGAIALSATATVIAAFLAVSDLG